MSPHDGFESHETERMPSNVLDGRRTLCSRVLATFYKTIFYHNAPLISILLAYSYPLEKTINFIYLSYFSTLKEQRSFFF